MEAEYIAINEHAPHCKRSARSGFHGALRFGLIVFVISCLALMIYFLFSMHFSLGRFCPSWELMAGAILVMLAGTIVMIVSRYRTLSSERLYVENNKVSLTKKGKVEWQVPLSDISRAETEVRLGRAGHSGYLLQLVLKNGDTLVIPWDLTELGGYHGVVERRGVLLPFELLRERNVPTPEDKHLIKLSRNRRFQTALMWVAVAIVLTLLGYMAPFVLRWSESSSLLHLQGDVHHSFRPWGHLRAINFTCLTPGKGKNIYIGTRWHGVIRFDGKSFHTSGDDLPPGIVKSLFFDKQYQRLWAVHWIPGKKPHEVQQVYYLDGNRWNTFRENLLNGRMISHVSFLDREMFLSTDKGLYRFYRNLKISEPFVMFKGQDIAGSFCFQDKLSVLVKKQSDNGSYLYSLYEENETENGGWIEIFTKQKLHRGLIVRDGSGLLWGATKKNTLSNLPSGTSHTFKHHWAVHFQKLVAKETIYVGAELFPSIAKSFHLSLKPRMPKVTILCFNPAREPSFLGQIEVFIAGRPIDFSTNESGDIWTFSD